MQKDGFDENQDYQEVNPCGEGESNFLQWWVLSKNSGNNKIQIANCKHSLTHKFVGSRCSPTELSHSKVMLLEDLKIIRLLFDSNILKCYLFEEIRLGVMDISSSTFI